MCNFLTNSLCVPREGVHPTQWGCLTPNPCAWHKISILAGIIILYSIALYMSITHGSWSSACITHTMHACEFSALIGFFALIIPLVIINHREGNIFPCTIPYTYKGYQPEINDGTKPIVDDR
jgi:hypothetical protein